MRQPVTTGRATLCWSSSPFLFALLSGCAVPLCQLLTFPVLARRTCSSWPPRSPSESRKGACLARYTYCRHWALSDSSFSCWLNCSSPSNSYRPTEWEVCGDVPSESDFSNTLLTKAAVGDGTICLELAQTYMTGDGLTPPWQAEALAQCSPWVTWASRETLMDEDNWLEQFLLISTRRIRPQIVVCL